MEILTGCLYLLRFVHDVQHGQLPARPPGQRSADQPGAAPFQLHLLPELLDLHVLEHGGCAYRWSAGEGAEVGQHHSEPVAAGQSPSVALGAVTGVAAGTLQRIRQGEFSVLNPFIFIVCGRVITLLLTQS